MQVSDQAKTLLDRFFDEEFTERDRVRFMDELATRRVGKQTFNFNVFDVVVDVDAGTVTIIDILEPNSEQVVAMGEFRTRLGSP
jgi:hypothetical protein